MKGLISFKDYIMAILGQKREAESLDLWRLTTNLFYLWYLVSICVFFVPLGILICIQTKNFMENETTNERFAKRAS